MSKIKMGRLQVVDNTKRIFGSAPKYIAVWVEDENGKNERCLLFTEREIAYAEERAKRNPEDITKRSILTDLFD